MVIVKVMRDMETPDEHLRNEIGYVHHKNRQNIQPLSLSGNGIDPSSLYNTYNQMKAVKEYYGKTSSNPVVHLMTSYDKASAPDAETACQLTDKIAEYYQDEYQSIQCTHEADHGSSWYHSHIVLNPVNYKNGMMMNTSIENMNQFCDYVSETTGAKTKLVFEKKHK